MHPSLQVAGLSSLFYDMKKEEYVYDTAAWHYVLYDLCFASTCTDLTPLYSQAGMA